MSESIRQKLEEQERKNLSPYAALSAQSRGRQIPEKECPVRTAFQRDRDRILHCKSFRRLKHKTQVFLSPTGDHYRTRLTHALEVAQIARTIARALRLNEDLTEAIALGHDLGHTPFGHAGEAVLNAIYPPGFAHYEQSLRVVDILENNGRGLNLTHEVREGILKHSKGRGNILPENTEELSLEMEGQIVRIADIIAYISHDIDDAIRGNVISIKDVPDSCVRALGKTHSKRIGTMVLDLIDSTIRAGGPKLVIRPATMEVMLELREFLYQNVYESEIVHREFIKAKKILEELYYYLLGKENAFDKEAKVYPPDTPRERMACDFIAGMTDRYALNLYESIFIPKPWMIY
ncbi:MAG: deoxyguanosinetriphosphate triphosphohydrolase [Thermodesulfobacteriota bacterium]